MLFWYPQVNYRRVLGARKAQRCFFWNFYIIQKMKMKLLTFFTLRFGFAIESHPPPLVRKSKEMLKIIAGKTLRPLKKLQSILFPCFYRRERDLLVKWNLGQGRHFLPFFSFFLFSFIHQRMRSDRPPQMLCIISWALKKGKACSAKLYTQPHGKVIVRSNICLKVHILSNVQWLCRERAFL